MKLIDTVRDRRSEANGVYASKRNRAHKERTPFRGSLKDQGYTLDVPRADHSPAFAVDKHSFDLDGRRGCIVTVTGEVDIATQEQFRTAMLDALEGEPGVLVLDFVPCVFGDTSIVRPVAEAVRRLRGRDGQLAAVVARRHAVRRVLELSGFEPTVALFEHRAEAIAALSAGERPDARGGASAD